MFSFGHCPNEGGKGGRPLPIYFYKFLTDIIASKYLSMCVQVKRASDLWKETNSQALDRLARLRGVFAIQHHEDVNLIVFFSRRQPSCLGEV